MSEERTELLSMFPEELAAYLAGEPAFRAKQVFSWLHKGASFEEMLNLPSALREKLRLHAADSMASVLERHVSPLDGTVKLLYVLRDGNCVEGVLMHYRYGITLCLSTQVGCRMGCAFCASTLSGLARNLTAAEMLSQVHCANAEIKEGRVSNIVLMGSGEPLDNYDHVVRFLRLVSHPEGLNIGLRHISLSTCGLVPQMLRFSEEGLPVTLSVSLHAPNDAIRLKMMPVAKTYRIEDILDACRVYIQKTGRRVIIEYAMAADINSDKKHAEELALRLRGMQCHVNLIPLNDVPERGLRGAGERQVADFLGTLESLHISATRRREMGDDIYGACGQLRRRHADNLNATEG